ncbi:Ppx/GppA phosphatase family protein [Isoptericola sp. b441]|uniref:Ppx/GppA phosphatase family protein n=1 Tax=Actinotalea lenta TaxID=3064654 RepID=A0ABT9DCA4_9CELL|nr:Ppx/GppA phosphatase family protein [Isoptericola sp. b441]MDO8106828.1 Ppx/GppA phosphatase family protein [Isoptericola sp. b441]
MTRVAAVDCGTNSVRLLVADVREGVLTDVVRRQEVVRLGEGVDRTGRISPEALARTLAVTRRYADEVRALGAEAVRFVATSASRDAENRDDFVAGVHDAIGVLPEVITGAEEAELSFRGATGALAGRHRGPFLVCDLGGGSTELVLGSWSAVASASMDVGSVRLTERHLAGDPPTPAEIAAAAAEVEAALDVASRAVPLGRAATLVGVAGTVTTVAAHALDLDEYDSAAIDGAVIKADTMLKACRSLLEMSRTRRARLPYVHPGRVDVIGAGALIWSAVISRVRAEAGRAGVRMHTVVVSERDILDGIALALAST